MIPYFQAGQAFVVTKGNPEGINTELDVCAARRSARRPSTTEIQYLEGTGLYKATGGLKKKCTDAGKAAPNAVTFEKDSDAFLALTAGQVDAYFADLPVAAYYVQSAAGPVRAVPDHAARPDQGRDQRSEGPRRRRACRQGGPGRDDQ